METELSVIPSGGRRHHSSGTTLSQRIPTRISKGVEHLFYGIGLRVARKPYHCLAASALCILLSSFGLYSFHQEKDPLKLWVPPDSDFVRDTRYLLNNVQSGLRMETLLLTADNVLEPSVLLQLHAITKRIVSARSRSQSRSNKTIAWTDVCFTVPSILAVATNRTKRQSPEFQDDFFDSEPGATMNRSIFEPAVYLDSKLYCSVVEHLPRVCLVYSILDLWAFDESTIKQETKQGVILRLDRTTTSPTLGHQVDFPALLGGIERDPNGRIVSAKAVKTEWAVRNDFTKISGQDFGNQAGTAEWATEDVLKWEAVFLSTLASNADAFKDDTSGNATTNPVQIRYEAGRSFGDVTETNIFQDIDKLVIGILLMFIYVLSVTSSANWIELRIWLTACGLLCVAGAFVIAVGLCSLLRIPYGPVHTSLPFMLLGLGIDDLFIITASWDQLRNNDKHKGKSLPERIASMLGQAGSAICITSLTDVVAFLIGASTILPSLQSFCIYAAVGVLANFLLQITCFVAFFTLDTRRIEAKRNAILPCIVPPIDARDEERGRRTPPSRSSSSGSLRPLRDYRHSRIILTTPGKSVVSLITVLAALFGIAGSLQIQQWFDPNWFLPKNSYLSEYNEARSLYYSDSGYEAFVLIGAIEYHREFPKIISLMQDLRHLSSVLDVRAWPVDFADFLAAYFEIDLKNHTLDRDTFHRHLSRFLFSRAGGKYQNNIQFVGQLRCGEMAPKIRLATIAFQFKAFHGPQQWILAMDESKRLASDAKITGFVTIWSKMFGSWLTDKLIAGEVLRNLLLALAAVMAITGSLIAQFQTCIWILSCVLLTILDVCGFMYFWGLTVNIVSCIALELAVGLSIDYSAHVAHAYLMAIPTTEGDGLDRKSRTEHALGHTGAAVAYGAGSTLLALSMMVFSDAYVFRTFFKIFFLVILLGIWHGLFFLPVVLSTLGPRSLRTNSNLHRERDRRRPSANLSAIHAPPPSSPITATVIESTQLLHTRHQQEQQQRSN